MSEPDELLGVVEPGDTNLTYDSVGAVLQGLKAQRQTMLDLIAEQTKVKLEAQAEVKRARAELETVDRLLSAATKRTRKPKA